MEDILKDEMKFVYPLCQCKIKEGVESCTKCDSNGVSKEKILLIIYEILNISESSDTVEIIIKRESDKTKEDREKFDHLCDVCLKPEKIDTQYCATCRGKADGDIPIENYAESILFKKPYKFS